MTAHAGQSSRARTFFLARPAEGATARRSPHHAVSMAVRLFVTLLPANILIRMVAGMCSSRV
jgi:hypothetical protein